MVVPGGSPAKGLGGCLSRGGACRHPREGGGKSGQPVPGFSFGIVGGGLTATAMLCQLVEKACKRVSAGQIEPSGMHVAVFEKAHDFGPGFPHNGRNLMPFHLTNMCAGDMGVYADRRGDFQVWVDRNLELLQDRFPGFPAEAFEPSPGPAACRHYPRAFMGEYLRTRFRQAVEDGRRIGMTVRLFPLHEVVDMRPAGDAVRIVARPPVIREPLEMIFHAVLLATGHWVSESRQENYFDSPWPAARLLARIPPGARVGVIGTSLSAIETALTLTSDGRFTGDADRGLAYTASRTPRTITLYSRRGLLPKVRGKPGAYRNAILTPCAFERICRRNGGRLELKTVFELLNAELEAAYGRPVEWDKVLEPSGSAADLLRASLGEAVDGDGPEGQVLWQSVLHQSFAFVREWYLGLTDEERRRFDRVYTSVFFTHAATQPRLNAAKLLALMEAGIVRVVRLGARYRFYRDERRACYCFDYTDPQGRPRSDSCPYVVDARGQSRFLDADPSELARSLIASGWIHIDRERVGAPASGSQGGRQGETEFLRAGSVRIDPRSHQVELSPPPQAGGGAVYAVGAMTRGQIIDASMAHGLSLSTATIADRILDGLSGQ